MSEKWAERQLIATDVGSAELLAQTPGRRIKIIEIDLQEVITGRFGRVQLPSEEEARYWLQQWREGAKPKQETPIRKIVIRRNRNEVKE